MDWWYKYGNGLYNYDRLKKKIPWYLTFLHITYVVNFVIAKEKTLASGIGKTSEISLSLQVWHIHKIPLQTWVLSYLATFTKTTNWCKSFYN